VTGSSPDALTVEYSIVLTLLAVAEEVIHVKTLLARTNGVKDIKDISIYSKLAYSHHEIRRNLCSWCIKHSALQETTVQN
jgi:hypothetical protein